MKIAEVLWAWRHHEGMSVRQAAEHIGIPSSTYARIEKGYPMNGEALAVIWRWMLSESL
jgi:transcriptional regulator with XRE-family HTH domain